MLKTVDLPTGEKLNIYVKPPNITVWTYHPYYKIRGDSRTIVLKGVGPPLSIGRVEAYPLSGGLGTAVYLNGVYKGIYYPKEKKLVHDTGWFKSGLCYYRETLWWDAQYVNTQLYFKREASSGCSTHERRFGVSPISVSASNPNVAGYVTYEVRVRRNVLNLPWLSLRAVGVPVYDGPYKDLTVDTPMGYRVEVIGGALKFYYVIGRTNLSEKRSYGNATVRLTEGSGTWSGWVKFVNVPVPLVSGADSYTVLAFPDYDAKTGFGFITPDVAYGVFAREWMDKLYIHWYDPSCGLYDEKCLRNATLDSPGGYSVSVNVPGVGVVNAVVTWDGQNIIIESGGRTAAGGGQAWMPLAYYRDPTPAYRYVIEYKAEWYRVKYIGSHTEQCGTSICTYHDYLVKSRGYLRVYLNGTLVNVDAYVGEGVVSELVKVEEISQDTPWSVDLCSMQYRVIENGTAFQEVRKEGDKVVLKVQDVKTYIYYNPCTGWTGKQTVFEDVTTVRSPQGNIWITDWYSGKTCHYSQAQPDENRRLKCP